jgi:hypothetical protein
MSFCRGGVRCEENNLVRIDKSELLAGQSFHAQLFLDADQLVVFGEPVGARQRAGLDLAAIGRDGEIGDGASSVSPERCDITAV